MLNSAWDQVLCDSAKVQETNKKRSDGSFRCSFFCLFFRVGRMLEHFFAGKKQEGRLCGKSAFFRRKEIRVVLLAF